MTAQQLNIDNLTHNLSNVNTVGFKAERVEFQSLLYETMTRASLDPANMTGRPVNLQVGHGVRPVATSRMFTQGALQRTDNSLDFAIEGTGFFVIQRSFEQIAFTRDGSFKLSPMEEGLTLVTATGYLVMSVDNEPIILPDDVDWINVAIDETGTLWHNTTEEMIDLGMQIQVVQFPNVQGLEAVGGNLLVETIASGAPIVEAEEDVLVPSRVHQGLLEMSNVNVAEVMVNVIIAQRAYDLASRAIHTSDEMLQTAVNLRR
jgi:flagellar basal-body rod protein FlgG